jgi:hypothetical protein
MNLEKHRNQSTELSAEGEQNPVSFLKMPSIQLVSIPNLIQMKSMTAIHNQRNMTSQEPQQFSEQQLI